MRPLVCILTGMLLLGFFVACDKEIIPDPDEHKHVYSGTITENATWKEGDTIILRGGVFVGNDKDETVLTIEPGVKIYGESSTKGMLVVTRGSRIIARGTAEKPIVMTSDKAPGRRARGDWGGLIINGRAPLNTGEEAYGEGGTGYYGGTDPNDNSGVLEYVRVEFAGREISPDNELNGIVFQGVGKGTRVSHIQVHMNADDGVEFFGGTVDAKYVYLTGIADDCFDYTDGWIGRAQFIVAKQWPDDGDNGFECDNNGQDNAAEPFSDPQIYNFTLVGVDTSSFSDDGMLLRAGTKGRFHNGIIAHFNNTGLDIDNSQTWANVTSGELMMSNCLFYNPATNNFKEDSDTTDGHYNRKFALELMQNNAEASGAVLISPDNLANLDLRPTGQALTHPYVQPPNDGFFEQVNFIGGIDPANDWTKGWTTHDWN